MQKNHPRKPSDRHAPKRSLAAKLSWAFELDPDAQIRRAQYEHLRSHCISAPLTSLIVALTLCAVLALFVDPRPALVWVAVLSVALTARLALCRWRPRNDAQRDRWSLWALSLAMVSGFVWGLAPLAPPVKELGALTVTLLVIGGVIVGMLPILGFIHKAYVTYTVVAITPSLVILFASGFHGHPAYLGLGLFLIAFALNLIRTGEVVTRTFLSNLRHGIAQTIAAEHDALTGLPNRRKFDREYASAWALAARAHTPLSVLILDLDHFKEYNDRYGHPAGDRCLKAVAETLIGALPRAADHLARIGGEEFVALLPATDAKGGRLLAERLRQAVEQLHIPHAASPVSPWLTISVGGATLYPTTATPPASLLDKADQALYAAKRAGRNRVEWAPGDTDRGNANTDHGA